MNPDNNREEQLFRDALARSAGLERKAFLDEACGNDPALRQRLDALLRAHGNPDPALESGAGILPASPAATIKLSFPDDPVPLEGPGTVIGRYRILEQIGEGGFGAVYVAEQREPVKRRVALKVIKLGMDTRQVVARFEAERQALAMMDHPNIAKVLDAGATETGRPYFVMELVRGIPITAYCDENALNTQQRLALFIQVCQAVQHAHQKGIIHRDLKPSNILVTLHDGVPVPMVIDFGIAKAMHGELTDKTVYTQFAQFIGTPAYVSPEQAEMSALDIDTRADIYSLGVLLYELLTGRVPFEAKELLEAGVDEMRRILREREPSRPSTRLGKMTAEELTTTAKRRGAAAPKLISVLRGDLDWVVMKCLEKDRTRRYDSASNLANDIQHHLASEPVAARPPSKMYRFQKAWRRNRLAFTAGAAVVAALVVGIGISAWQAVVATRAKAEAVEAKSKESEQRLAAQKERDKAVTAQQAEKRARLRADAEKEEAAHNLYVANMGLARQAWEENSIDRLRQALEDTKDSPYRGFEWYYWQQQTHLALKTLCGHVEAVVSVAFSPDGQRIVTGSGDNTAKVWDAAGGRELLTLKGHSQSVSSVAYSPDGQRILTGSEDGTAKVWAAASGRELFTLRRQRGQVMSVTFSVDGQRIVTGSYDGTVRIWGAANGGELSRFNAGGMVHSVAISPDGRRIATGIWSGPGNTSAPAKVWEAATGRELLTLKGHTEDVLSVAFSPDGKGILTGSGDGTAKLWDVTTGRELLTLKGHTDALSAVAFSPDGKRIVTGGRDRTAKVWEAASGRELITLKGHTDWVASVAFSPDGQRIVTGGDKIARVWGAASGLSAGLDLADRFTLQGHTEAIFSLAFSPDGQRIVTRSQDTTARVWETATGRELCTLKGHTPWITFAAFSSDGRRVLTSSYDNTAKVWDAVSGRELIAIKAAGSMAFSPDGQRIATGSTNHTAKVLDTANSRELLTLRGHSNEVVFLAFSPDGQRIVTCSRDRTAKVWEAASGRELSTLAMHTEGIQNMVFSPDGQRIAAGGPDKMATVWDAMTGRELSTLKGHTEAVWSLVFSPDGKRIVTTGGDRTAKVWDVATGRELFTLRGHAILIYSVTFSPDGRRIATGGADNTAKVWDADNGRELLTLKGHKNEVFSVAFSPDGRYLITGSGDTTAKVWEAAGAAQVVGWEEEERRAARSLAGLEQEWNDERDRQSVICSRESIKKWLVLGPIALSPGQSGMEGLDVEQIEDESRLRPKAGIAASIAGRELRWREVAVEDSTIDFKAVLGIEATQMLAYAVCYLRSEAEQRGIQMLVGEGPQATIYLNEKRVYSGFVPTPSPLVKDYVQNLSLDAGLNVLVLKAATSTNAWRNLASVCLTDGQGNPLKGVTVTLDPEQKDKTELKQP